VAGRFLRLTLPLLAAACIAARGAPAPDADPAQQATRAAALYLDHATNNRALTAIDQCVDLAGFDRLVFGKDFDQLPPEKAAYAAQLTAVLLKSQLGPGLKDMQLVSGSGDIFRTAPEGPNIRVTFNLVSRTPGAAEKRTLSLLAAPGSPEWKIVDVDGQAAATAASYEKCKPVLQGGPVAFLENEIAIVLARKMAQAGAPEGAKPQEPVVRSFTDPRAATIREELDALRPQIELFRARDPNRAYPDFAKSGWNDLLRGGYIKRPPANPVNRRTEICIGTAGKTTCGWHWDPATGTLGASYYDEESGAVTPGKP
jgi:hypothetical protein